MLYKNWPAICQIGNLHFRLAVALATDEEFLSKIAQVFPNLFTETKPEHPGPFPLSYLREVASRYCAVDGQDRSCIDEPMNQIGMPHVLLVNDPDGWDEGSVLTAPGWFEKHLDMFREEYERGSFPFDLYRVQINDEGTIYYLGLVNHGDNGIDPHIYLFPVDLVDENT